MTRTNQNTTLWQGIKKVIKVHLTKQGAALVLTDATIEYALTDTTTDKRILKLDNGDDGGIAVVSDGTAPGAKYSVIWITIAADATEDLTGENYRHQLQITESGGATADMYMTGQVTIKESDILKTVPSP